MTSGQASAPPKQKPNKASNKKLIALLDAFRSPVALGLYLTAAFIYVAFNFYQIKNLNEVERRKLSSFRIHLFEGIEYLDLKNMDGRFNMRGEMPPSPQVALLTIDDRSIEEIGRWPWSREKMAFLIDEMMKYEAKAVGFDIVFSEPQVDSTAEALNKIESDAGTLPAHLKKAFDAERAKGQPDLVLAATLAKHRDKLILGAFNEESGHEYTPYQDYCRNEAFKRANADKFVKLNATFIVDDIADPFVDIDFSKIFDQMFPVIEQVETEKTLKNVFGKSNITDLSPREIAQLQFLLEQANMSYCDIWLKDGKDSSVEALSAIYLDIFKKSPLLTGLDLASAIKTFKASVKPIPVAQHQRWTINTDQLQEGSDYTGSFNAEQDADGTIRRASLFFRTGNRIGTSYIPSIALQTYLVASGHRADIEINVDPKYPDQKILSKFNLIDPSTEPESIVATVPVDPQGRVTMNYSGGRNMYPYLSAKELFNGKDTAVITQSVWNKDAKMFFPQEFTVKKAEFIKDKAFIIGATAIGVYDLRVTPFEKNYPGPETHVTALGNLFAKNFIKTHPQESQIMLWSILVLGVCLSVAIAQTTAIPGFLITFGTLGLVALVDQWLIKKYYVSTMALPMVLILFLYVFLFFYKYLTEERKKKHLRSTFSKYVSPAIVDEILKDPENIELGGKKLRMSVFFSDVRGFTTMSEKLDPRALSDVLTRYLTPMTQIVFANKGTLDKYMGDALMAFFGAPIQFPDHAKYACRTALQSLVKLKEIQKEFKSQGLPEIDIGIGINTAEMSVGNMGSDIVRSYTVMGDAVNLASRLEGINKEYGTRIVISQFTHEDVKNEFTARELDWVRVKGKNEPVRIFELVCEGTPDEVTANLLQNFNQGFESYHKKDFTGAMAFFKKCLDIRPDDNPAKMYVERCEDFITEPPPQEWDGVYVMKTK